MSITCSLPLVPFSHFHTSSYHPNLRVWLLRGTQRKDSEGKWGTICLPAFLPRPQAGSFEIQWLLLGPKLETDGQMVNWGAYLTYQNRNDHQVFPTSLIPYLLQNMAGIPHPYPELPSPGARLHLPLQLVPIKFSLLATLVTFWPPGLLALPCPLPPLSVMFTLESPRCLCLWLHSPCCLH